jgi:hypothetical protein
MRYRTRSLLVCLFLFLSLLLSACGGGGGGGDSSNAGVVSLPPSAASVYDSNVTTIDVKSGPFGNVNIPFVSIHVCTSGGVVGSSNCKSIDHVLLDTGSTGLRLFANQVNGAITLPPQTVASSSAIFECANFLNNNAWGKVVVADVSIGTSTERAANVPIQLMDASDAGAVNCNSASLISTVTNTDTNAPPLTDALRANGILGLGLFVNDGQNYFDCTVSGAGCAQIFPASAKQVTNPVALFRVTSSNGVRNNNGVVLQLPTLPLGYAVEAQGYLIFGVGTQSNNQLNGLAGVANVVRLNSGYRFTTVYKGMTFTDSFMDSGSNGLYFDDASLLSPACARAAAGFYCSNSPNLTATIQSGTSNFTVGIPLASADSLLFRSPNNFAFSTLGGRISDPAHAMNPPSSSFDWGLPFFFGRAVYTVIENASVSGVAFRGPWNAFTN